MTLSTLKIPRPYHGIARITLCLLIIFIISWLALRPSWRNTSAVDSSPGMLDSVGTIFEKAAAPQVIAIQCNSWRLLNQHVYLLDTKGKHLTPTNVVTDDSSNTVEVETNGASRFKIELGLAGPHTISLYHPLTAKYLARTNDSQEVKLIAVNHLADKSARLAASWTPYVYQKKDGSRTYMFNSVPMSTDKWLQDNLAKVGSNQQNAQLLLRETETGRDLTAPILRHESVAENQRGDTSALDYPTRVVCNALEDTENYRSKQLDYMAEYYGYYDRANAEAARVRELGASSVPSNSTLVEGFGDASSGMRRGDRRKRTVKALKMNGMLDDLTVKTQELFADTGAPASVSDAPSMDDFNAAKANVFQPHTGLQFNDILNHHAETVKTDITEDRIFDRLERAKMDPSVQNLLDYNEERAKIYQKENEDFQQRLNGRVRENREKTNNLVRRMDQHRIREMSRRLFFLKNHTN